jgi:hypothetical protein
MHAPAAFLFVAFHWSGSSSNSSSVCSMALLQRLLKGKSQGRHDVAIVKEEHEMTATALGVLCLKFSSTSHFGS